MKSVEQTRYSFSMLGIEGVFFSLSPITIACIGSAVASPLLFGIQWFFALGAIVANVVGSLLLYTTRSLGKIVCCIGLASTLLVAVPFLKGHPAAALLAIITAIYAIFSIVTLRIYDYQRRSDDKIARTIGRVRWAAIGTIFVAFVVSVFAESVTLSTRIALVASTLVTLLSFARYAAVRKTCVLRLYFLGGIIVLGISNATTDGGAGGIHILLSSAAVLLTMGRSLQADQEKWWIGLLNHPARLMLVTFLLLCIGGAFLLSVPFATTGGAIDPVNAAFTSVSAVCVTGLTVLDTPKDFTFTGQLFIVLLIQLGGLGIMSITTVALHAFGRRMSLQQEQVMISLTDTDHRELIAALRQIIQFTLIVEAIGAAMLTYLFFHAGESLPVATWRAVFTAVSAFCNAGFALQTDSLVPYVRTPLILQTVGILIILGGIAPATNLLIPRWLQRKQIPLSSSLTLLVTILLLVSGTLFFLMFEWNGILGGESPLCKVSNAFFQSVTLRTAGFNSVPLTEITTPSFLFMNLFMLIGGSPGGTAGGIKTTTLGVLLLTFFATISNRREIVLKNRRIPHHTIFRAITICISGAIIWLLAVIMMSTTQQLSAREIIFEVSSALGTVGLSIGATMQLDEIGKTIIMVVMFAGRVGPMTLFMLLGRERIMIESSCPEARITLA